MHWRSSIGRRFAKMNEHGAQKRSPALFFVAKGHLMPKSDGGSPRSPDPWQPTSMILYNRAMLNTALFVQNVIVDSEQMGMFNGFGH